MHGDSDLAAVAAVIGVRARADMLSALFGGRALPASALAAAAGISRSNASGHLARLTAAGLVSVSARDRHRYYRLASEDVARALELLGTLAPPRSARGLREVTAAESLRFARTCYDHLAGQLAVALAERFQADGLLEAGDGSFVITPRGRGRFERFGVPVARLALGRRPLARACLDSTERRPHVAGSFGAGLLARLQQLEWVLPLERSRALRLTEAGTEGLRREFALLADPGRGHS